MTDPSTYRKALDNRIKAGKVFLNDKQTLVTGYEELGALSFVVIDGKERILTENDNLIINGHKNETNKGAN